MKNFFKILLFVSFFIAPLITNAQPWSLFGEPKQDDKYTPLTEKQRQEKRDWLITNTDFIIQGGLRYIGGFTYQNEVCLLSQLTVTHVYRGVDIPKHIFVIVKATGYIPTEDERFPFKENPNPVITKETHYFNEYSGVFFLKRNTIPIVLPDTSKMISSDAGVYYPHVFYPNPLIHFDASVDQVYQLMDDSEWGFEFCGDLQCYGLYGKKISFQGMCHFLHQYSNIETPYGEEFINDYDPNDENQSQEIQDSTNLFENRSQLLKKNEYPIDSIKLEKFNT